VTGATSHFVGGVDEKGGFRAAPAPVPAWVEIEESESGWTLLRLDAGGEPITDTWHESLVDAKEQARFEYEIAEHDWQAVS
jgi:hypothetical protein